MKKIILSLLLPCSFMSNASMDYNKNFPKSLLSLESDYTLIQLPNDKLYLVNEKSNYKGCQKVLSKPAFEWNVKARKYLETVKGSDDGISKDNLKKLNYILLTDTPINKKIEIKKQIEEKTKSGEIYCEALSANFK